MLLLVASANCVESQQIQATLKKGPSLNFFNSESGRNESLELKKLAISINVVGTVATTTMDMTFHNNLNRVLEGELVFPLAEGQTVSSFAMELNGSLRQGVVVEKEKGQKVFETIVRRKVDPALLEWTTGNNFRARVYPIFGNGDKRIVLGYEQELGASKLGLDYDLPLEFNTTIELFTLNVFLSNSENLPIVEQEEFKSLNIKKDAGNYSGKFKKEKFFPPSKFSITIPKTIKSKASYVDLGNIESVNYFLIQDYKESVKHEKILPQKLAIYWDASSSGRNRNLDMELKLLSAYLKKNKNVDIQLILFSNQIDSVKNFRIIDGETLNLTNYIKQIKYDGATQLGILDFNLFLADEILLFSDGVSNFGFHEIILSKTPVIAINSTNSANHSYLNYICNNTNGAYINLAKIDFEKAKRLIFEQNLKCLSVSYNANEISEVYPSNSFICDENFSITGKLLSPKASLTLNFGYGDKIIHSEKYILTDEFASNTGVIERLWVQKKITELQTDWKNNDKSITDLGKKYSVVTRNTSLIVLETLSDYVQYEIVPPIEMQKEYSTQLQNKINLSKENENAHLNKIVNLYNQKINWWNDNTSADFNGKSTNPIFNVVGQPNPVNISTVDSTNLLPAQSLVLEAVSNNVRRIQGKVYDAETREPIPFAYIASPSTNTSTTTDFDGRFSFDVPENSEIRLTYVGYQTVFINTKTLSFFNIPLSSLITNLETVEIVEYRVPLISQGVTSSGGTITSEEIRRMPGRASGNANTVQGVFSSDGNDVNIRGARSEGTITYIDGVRVRGSAKLNQAAIDQVSVYTGGLPASIGDAQSSSAFFPASNNFSIVNNSPNRVSNVYYSENSANPSPWLKKIEHTKSENLYEKYLELKNEFGNNTSFYREVSEIFWKKDLKNLAIKILSNLVEIEHQNYSNMRVVARRLQQMHEYKTSIEIFKEILKLRPEEPQSYRDLGLALADDKQYQDAVNILYEMILKKWDSRFLGIEAVVLGEMNAIIKNSDCEIDVSKIDKRLLVDLPMDIRVVLNWDANNTDVDLWVTDPNNEKCFYGKRKTAMGGYMSFDLRGGYGPEEFLLKNAKSGKYKIEFNYYGNQRNDEREMITVQVQVFTNYGSKNQTVKEFTKVLNKKSETVYLGDVVFEEVK